jgi:hypothetical protein
MEKLEACPLTHDVKRIYFFFACKTNAVEMVVIIIQFNSKCKENIIALNDSSVLNGKIITEIFAIANQERFVIC